MVALESPGGWAFEFVNNWYPDVDDSSMVLVALKEGLADPAKHQAALQQGINWCLGMQCQNGGFASFDKDNTKEWLNAIPFGDLKALVDPPTEDITGRILEMMGAFGYCLDHPAARRALAYLKRTQRPEGPWWGRWGVNYLYGTWSVLCQMYPEADIPVVQLSLDRAIEPADHYKLASMLSQLRREEVLVVGDTPLDIRCARAIGARVLAVATGGSTLSLIDRAMMAPRFPSILNLPGPGDDRNADAGERPQSRITGRYFTGCEWQRPQSSSGKATVVSLRR